jgi:small subunit ribosomal protein S1
MDSSHTMTGVETSEDELEDILYAQEDQDLAPEQGETGEMRELPVEDWDYQQPRRGQVRTGVILSIREQEIVVGVGAKRDGIVPYSDMQRLGAEALAALSVGDKVPVYVLRPEDQDGNLLVSLNMARQEQAWLRASELADSEEIFEDRVIGYNKGGLVIPVGDIRGFIPASQVPGFPRGLSQEERLKRLADMVGQMLQVKVIEINQRKRRLILSATIAQRQWRKQQRESLLAGLREGEVRKGVVSGLCTFGAFVDLGGADGLIHVSELSWRRVRHPREVLKVGDEVEVYVLRLDPEKKRIGLSLKRLQPEPWALVEDKYELGQLVEGVVTNVVDFGAFAEIEDGVEGLIHVSELADGQISHPRDVVKRGDLLLLRIIRIDTRRKRLGLSLKRVLESEWAEWAARLAEARAGEEAEMLAEELVEAQEVEALAEELGEAEETELLAEELEVLAEELVEAEETELLAEELEVLAEELVEAEETELLVEELEVLAEELVEAEGVEVVAEELGEAEGAETMAEETAEAEALPDSPSAELQETEVAETAVKDPELAMVEA